LHSIVDRAEDWGIPTPVLLQQSSSSCQANGGAYLRLDTDNDSRPDSSRISSARASNRDESRLQQTTDDAASLLTGGDGGHGNSSVCDVYVHRKRSTFRNKDHFGRSANENTGKWEWSGSGSGSEGLVSALLVLGGLILLAALWPAANAYGL
ncbi:hypothetical protein B0A55_10390, partial [Friedmanniomyces simplex]